MRRLFSISLLAGTFLVWINTESTAAMQAPSPAGHQRTVLDGVYTPAQAARGRAVFARYCIGCHQEPTLSGSEAAPLKGPVFLERWREHNLTNLYMTAKTTMPRSSGGNPDSPGSDIRLADEQYIDIMAFVLMANDYPAASEELTAENVGSVLLVGGDGPQPIPNLAVVGVVGCLSANSSNTWTLTRATQPWRTINARELTPAELAEAKTQPLGTEVLSLRNFDLAFPPINPNLYKGHKVQVKGVLRRLSSPPGQINVLSIGSVSAACGE